MKKAISWTFLAYFIILFAERAQSIVRELFFRGPLELSAFDVFVTIVACISISATLVLLAGFNADFWRSLFNPAKTPDYARLTLTAGVILLSGMMHTEFTIAPVQFVAYGALIIGMILQTVLNIKSGGNAFRHWFSLTYITAFSMAIPVMYRSNIRLSVLFHVIEAVAAIVLVAFFTLALRRIFTGNANDLLSVIPFASMAVLDAVILALRWTEYVNTFVLIFAVLSAVLFAAGKVLFHTAFNNKEKAI